ncbi:MAG: PIN domain-containing protein [Myxococcaceae bacterium]|nr:PIN domain-containing protein [Myxococcaceae bacterium]
MKAIDTHILVYAHRPDVKWHEAAKRFLGACASGKEPWAIPFHCLVEFAAVVSNRRLWLQPSSPVNIRDQVDAWLESPTLEVLSDERGSWKMLAELMEQGRVEGGAIHDARIAACCLFNGVSQLCTLDRDFSRFPQLKTVNPLAT